MATRLGAQACHIGDITGSLEIGKRADLSLLSLQALHTTPHPDPVSAIVYAAEANDVETVIIDGRVVMRDGELKTLNEHEVVRAATEMSAHLRDRAKKLRTPPTSEN